MSHNSILIVGSIAIDTVETPFEKQSNVLGGSTTYSLVASGKSSHISVVGIVGAGGIGAHLLTSVQRYEYATTATILFAIIAIVITLEYSSGYLRKWVQ